MLVACVQIDSQLGQFAANVATVERLLREHHIAEAAIDLLVLPEMALVGYCFRDRVEIEPFAESRHDGPTIAWLRTTAQRLHCTIACGFVERDRALLYNAMAVVDRHGELVHVHRKHFLYHLDESWATPGPGFKCREVTDLGRAAFAICMDLNPKGFVAPFDAYEFAASLFDPPLTQAETPTHHRLQANLIIACNAWLRPAAEEELTDDQRCLYLMNYWATRLAPALDKPVLLALANRVGAERGTIFAGTSCVLDLQHRQILGHLGPKEEGVLLVDAEGY